jgi:3-phenylpropionate/trans-cinnamate dioxygenase ferredoxin component
MNHSVARTADIPPGTAKAFAIDGADILVCNVDGSFFAIEDVCTHDGGALDQGTLEGRCVVCPRHGAAFDVETGAAVRLPAVMGLQTFNVRVEDDAIVIEI